MKPKLPPPDPHEPLDVGPARVTELPGPMAVVVGGESSAEDDRISDAILELRPGLLFVYPAA